jgi:hypothetical protein
MIDHKRFRQAALAAAGCAMLPASVAPALAQPPGYDPARDQGYQDAPPGYDGQQGSPPAQGSYDQAPPQGYGDEQGEPPSGNGYPPSYGDRGAAPQGDPYGGPPPSGYPAPPPPPPGYNGSAPPPPPPGYQSDPRAAADQQAQDQRYAVYAQQWEQAYCVKAHGNTGEGAVLGGVVGALLGSGIAGRGSRGAGAVVGAGVGAVGGAAIASSSNSNATSPGCPPGYVVRNGAPAFSYGGYGQPYLYAAPGWYQPWVFYGGVWTYRPYPYHTWYYGHYGWGGGYRGHGYYGRRGYGRRP